MRSFADTVETGATEFNDPNGLSVAYKILTIDADDQTGTVEVSGSAIDENVTEITIPATVTLTPSVRLRESGQTYNKQTVFTVVGITGGFSVLHKLVTVNIPLCVEYIKQGAFNNCSSLKNFNIGDPSKTAAQETSKLKAIGDFAFGDTGLKKLDLSKCKDLNLSDDWSLPEAANWDGTPFISHDSGENQVLEELIIPNNVQIGQSLAGLSALKKLNQDADGNNHYAGDLWNRALLGTGLENLTLDAPTEPTVNTQYIGEEAFKNSKIKKLTINSPIVLDDAIDNEAFVGMKDLEEVYLNGLLGVEDAIPCVYRDREPVGAFPDSKLKKLEVNGNITKAGAIDDYAFVNQDELSTITFNGSVAAGGIGDYAFTGIGTKEGNCATVIFNNELQGENAIGEHAFEGAGIQTLYFGTKNKPGKVGKKAIGEYAFSKIKCNAQVRFWGPLDVNAIQKYAFKEAELTFVVFHQPIDKDNVVMTQAFRKAVIIGSETASVVFLGELSGDNVLGKGAFYEAEIQKPIYFYGDISGKNAIGYGAFAHFTNILGSTKVEFKGNITGENAIGEAAFKKSAVGTVNIKGSVIGVNAISWSAFESCKTVANIDGVDTEVPSLTSVNIDGEIFNDSEKYGEYAICPKAFADNGLLAEINLAINGTNENNIWARYYSVYGDVASPYHAIAPTAFDGAGADIEDDGDTFRGATLNVGRIKSPGAIEPGAFGGAKLEVVNFNELMAEEAIADDQFAKGSITLNNGESDVDLDWDAALINTVNFNKEIKQWENPYWSANEDFIGEGAFTGTEVTTVNFNEAITKEFAISGDRENGPFAFNGAEMTVNFNKGVCREGIAPGAFAASNTVEINLDNNSEYAMDAFMQGSFMMIALEYDEDEHEFIEPTDGKFNVQVNYTDPTVKVYRSFNQRAFYPEEPDFVDIQFNTTEKVLKKYTTASNYEDLTPYRMKIIATKYIHLTEYNGQYWGVFDPQDEQYVIEKYQQDATVGVYAGYVDDKTVELWMDPASPLDADGNPTEPYKFDNGRPAYTAKMYMNPLRIQDNGKYVVNAGHTLIVVADKDIEVECTQDLVGYWGGVQTFAALTPWQCNDLRFNPAKIEPIYAPGENVFPVNDIDDSDENYMDHKWAHSHVWPGFVSQVAVLNGERDYYGNVMRDYAMFTQAAGTFSFNAAQTLEQGQVYVLAAPVGGQPAYTINAFTQEHQVPAQTQIELREKYSTAAMFPSLYPDAEGFYVALFKAMESVAEIQQSMDGNTLDEIGDYRQFVYDYSENIMNALYIDAEDIMEEYSCSEDEVAENLAAYLDDEYDIDDFASLLAAIQERYYAPARLTLVWNDESMVTGIMEHVVRGDAATMKSEAVYNLNGMRVNKAQKGVFIQNGKKIIK